MSRIEETRAQEYRRVPDNVFAQFLEPLGTRPTPLAPPMQEHTLLDSFFNEVIALAGNLMPLEENVDDVGIVKAVELATDRMSSCF